MYTRVQYTVYTVIGLHWDGASCFGVCDLWRFVCVFLSFRRVKGLCIIVYSRYRNPFYNVNNSEQNFDITVLIKLFSGNDNKKTNKKP